MISWDWDFTKPTVWVFVGMFFATIPTQVGDQPLMQRMLATADVREAKRTVVLGNIIGLASSVIFFFVGTALYVFYRQHPDRAHGGSAERQNLSLLHRERAAGTASWA